MPASAGMSFDQPRTNSIFVAWMEQRVIRDFFAITCIIPVLHNTAMHYELRPVSPYRLSFGTFEFFAINSNTVNYFCSNPFSTSRT